VDIGVGVKEIFYQAGFVRRDVVGDDVDFFATRLIHHNVGQEGDELGEV
jgi:hypothetical protein